MFCGKCGVQLPDGEKVCTQCGFVLEAPVEQSAEVMQEQMQTIIEEPTDALETVVQETVEAMTEEPDVSGIAIESGEKNKITRVLLSALCSVLIFIFAFSLLCVVTAKISTQVGKLEKVSADLNVTELMENDDVRGMLADDIKKKDVEKMYAQGTFKVHVAQIMSDLINGKVKKVEAEPIINAIRENEDILREVTGGTPTEENYIEVEDFVEGRKFRKNVTEKLEPMTTLSGVALSIYTMIGLAVLLLACIVWMCLLRKKANALLWCGIPISVSGVLGVAMYIATLFTNEISEEFPAMFESLVKSFVEMLLTNMLFGGLIVMAVGIVLIVVFCIMHSTSKKRMLRADEA